MVVESRGVYGIDSRPLSDGHHSSSASTVPLALWHSLALGHWHTTLTTVLATPSKQSPVRPQILSIVRRFNVSFNIYNEWSLLYCSTRVPTPGVLGPHAT